MSEYAPVLSRITDLIDAGGLTRDPLPLLALRDGFEAHDDASPAGVLLWAALTSFYESALLWQAADVDAALVEMRNGRALLSAFCTADR